MTFHADQLAVFARYSEHSFHGLLTIAADEIAKGQRALKTISPLDVVEISKAQARVNVWESLQSLPKQLQEYAEKSAPSATSGNK
jgi:hypothetical protein